MPKNVIKEREDYQRYILDYLKDNNGYVIRNANTDFNRAYAMDIELLFKFLDTTQPETMEQLRKIYKENAQTTIINHINKEITKLSSTLRTPTRGILDVLKNGVYFDNGLKLELMYKKPATDLNPELSEKYDSNILSVMEEVYHKDGERIDLVIFLNGFAIMSFELKANTSGQDYHDAIRQFKTERDYTTRLFMFKAGCLVNFAMDLKEVYMATRLNGKPTFFLPFNMGTKDGGKGNPTGDGEFNVSYMWEDVLTKDAIIELISKFIFVQKKKEEDPKTGKMKEKETLIFPRYHQRNCVKRLLDDVRVNKSTLNYLIQHSAGSGKTNTIAWLSHRLASLHDADDEQIFDNIIIITDRVVVDRQLQDAVQQIEHQDGFIKVLDDDCDSDDLKTALEGNTKIVVSTIQKFRFILDKVKALNDKRFAVIIDEAHSSTAGSNMAAVTMVLASDPNVEIESEEISTEDYIVDEINKNGKQENVSMFAFTATPKPQTLQLFGTMQPNGDKEAFDVYSMRQAIEEGFILDVLQNYTTYDTYYHINKIVENDPMLGSVDGKRQIARFVELHDTNIAQKVEIIIEHFKTCVLESPNVDINLGGDAKAMVITSSIEAAIKYRNAFQKYIEEKGYKNIHALVAFSGKKKVEGKEYSEPSMNGVSEDKLPKTFDGDDYQVLIVANKYQTGFDQPKLVAMYVDKKLSDVACVQTLSRLNRICPPFNKVPFVLDFKNDYEDIVKAFEKYYTVTDLVEGVNPSSIFVLGNKLNEYNILNWDDIERFNELLYKPDITRQDKIKMENLVDKALKKVYQHDVLTQLEIRTNIRAFNKFYAFLIQATCFENVDIHKKYNFLTYLVNEIEIDNPGTHISLKDKISATNFMQKKTGEHTDPKLKGDGDVKFSQPTPKTVLEQQLEFLSNLIKEINNQTGSDFDADITSKSLLQVKDILLSSNDLKESARANDSVADFTFDFDDAMKKALKQGDEESKKFFRFLLNNVDVRKQISSAFIDDIYTEFNNQ